MSDQQRRAIVSAVWVALMLGGIYFLWSGAHPVTRAPGLFEEAPIRINPEAKVRVVEFFAYTCPACQRFHRQVFPRLVSFIERGEIGWAFWPVRLHEGDTHLSKIAFCAWKLRGIQAFLQVQDQIFEDGQPSNPVDPEVAACAEHAPEVAEQGREKLIELRLPGTPSFFVNDRFAVAGVRPLLWWKDRILGRNGPAKRRPWTAASGIPIFPGGR